MGRVLNIHLIKTAELVWKDTSYSIEYFSSQNLKTAVTLVMHNCLISKRTRKHTSGVSNACSLRLIQYCNFYLM